MANPVDRMRNGILASFGFSCLILVTLSAVFPGSSTGQTADTLLRPILHFTVTSNSLDSQAYLVLDRVDGKTIDSVNEGISAAWSPSGSAFAYVTLDRREIRLRDLSKRESVLFTVNENQKVYPRITWASDGKQLAFLLTTSVGWGFDTCALMTIDPGLRSNKRVCLIPGDVVHLPKYTSAFFNFRWSPDGQKILIAWQRAAVIDIRSGRVEEISPEHSIAEWAPDSKSVYLLKIDDFHQREESFGEFARYDLESKKISLLNDKESVRSIGLRPKGMCNGIISMSPTFHKLAIVTGSFPETVCDTLRIYSMSDQNSFNLGRPLKTIASNEIIAELDWGPDENYLALLTLPNGTVSLKVLNLEKSEWHTVKSIPLKPSDYEIFIAKLLSWSR